VTETVQEDASGVLTSSTPNAAEVSAEGVTTLAASFLRRIGHKGPLKPKRVSQEGDLYTVEIDLKQSAATVKVDALNQQIKEYDVQPISEESPLASLAPKTLMIMIVVSAIVNVGLYFAFKLFGF
jgi:hypothetical protein